MPWARFSSLSRHLCCPAASTLPSLDRGTWRPPAAPGGLIALEPRKKTQGELDKEAEWSVAADNGTALHAVKALGTLPEGPLREAGEVLLRLRAKLWPTRLGHHEVGVSYDCQQRTAELYRGTSAEVDAWKASRPVSCVVGTADWLGELPSGEPWVDDLKTGREAPEAHNDQTLGYQLCAVLARHGRSRDWTTTRQSITHFGVADFLAGKVTEPDRTWVQTPLTRLEELEMDIQDAYQRVMTRPNETVAGMECQFCPSVLVCPRGRQ